MEIIIGVYNKTIFRSLDDGYTIFSLITKELEQYRDANGNLICGGKIPTCVHGMPLKLSGSIVNNNDKILFQIKSFELFSDNRQLTLNYLISDTFQGIGPKTAEKIVNITGANIFEFATQAGSKELLTQKIPELDDKKVSALYRGLRNSIIQEKLYTYIQRFGGTYMQAISLYDKASIKTQSYIIDNIFTLGRAVGMPFVTCDAIAKENGCHVYNNNRITALVFGALNAVADKGNTCINFKALVKLVNVVAKSSAFPEEIPAPVISVTLDNIKGVVVDYSNNNILIYNKSLWAAEEQIASALLRLSRSAKPLSYNPDIISVAEKALCVSYSYAQKKSFDFLKKSGVKILTGGPGTGKTTIIKGLIFAYKQMFPNGVVTLCAPTGRAAQRMTESTGMIASTIHRLLDIKPFGETMSCKNQSDPLETSFLIVDETSMADTELMALLLNSLKKNTLVLLCGDVDQLPSVGAGNVLNDLIESNLFEMVRLNKIYRQDNTSNIVYNADLVKRGEHQLKNERDVEIVKANSQEALQKLTLKYATKYYNSKNQFALQVLTPTKKYYGGTIMLNSLLQEQYNKSDANLLCNFSNFKLGDKVIMTKNNYEIGYFNGDMGVITDINGLTMTIDIDNEAYVLEGPAVKDVSLAYAITTHKSQGSEYETVIVVLPDKPKSMLQQKLLYTAMTRARSRLIIIYENDALDYAIDNCSALKRTTTLKKKVCNIFNGERG